MLHWNHVSQSIADTEADREKGHEGEEFSHH